MKQFNLSEWLKNKSRKVTTRLGNREVRIICWDRKNNDNRPIITLMIDPNGNEYITYHTKNGFVDEKEKYLDKRDLFFADEGEGLTEFEKKLKEILYEHATTNSTSEQKAKQYAPELLDLARKEILKDLLKWTKWKIDCLHNLTSVIDGRLYYNGYYIDINELEKLSKEE